MKEELITLETAKLAKEVGFNEESNFISYYNVDGKIIDGHKAFCGDFEEIALAPYQSVLHKWLREKQSIYIDIYTDTNVNEILGFDVKLKSWRFPPIYVDVFLSWEEALENGLQEALKLIKKWQ